VGQSLFGCAMQNWSSLTPEQRAHCSRPGEGVAIREAPNLMGQPDQVQDEAHWSAEWRRKETPLLLTGANPDKFGLALWTTGGKPSLLGGSQGKTVLYDIQQPAPEALYKTEQAYDARHKAHAGAPGSPERIGVHPE
jgi:hypothetical protein